MKSIFPPSPQWLSNLVAPYVDAVHLPYLKDHLHVLVGAALAYQLVFVFSGTITDLLGIKSYRSLNPKSKLNWDIHVVSMVQCIVICIAAAGVTYDDTLKKDKIFAYSPFGGDVYAMATGYFLWDAYVSLRYILQFGTGFALHAIASFFVFLFSFRPFLMYYGPSFLAFELSTPFVNIHWFLDKMQMTGGTLQMINGVLLLCVFFSARIAWGWYSAFHVFYNMWQRRNLVPAWLGLTYLVANLSLNILNMYWFSKMIDALRRRLQGERVSKKDQDMKIE